MTTTKKLLLGGLSLWPLVYIFIFVAYFLFNVSNPDHFNAVMPFLFFFHFLTILLIFGLMLFYVVHAVRNPRVSGNMKIVWVICLVQLNIMAVPIYWFLEIWKAPEDTLVLDAPLGQTE